MQTSTPHAGRSRANRAPRDEPPSNVCYRARCGLCSYPLAHRDKTIVLEQHGVELPKGNLAFSPCRERCPHSRGQATAYHRDCAQGIFSGPPERAAAVHQLGHHVMSYAYDPPAVEVARRNKWLSDALLSCMIGGVLPPEICREITAAAMRDQAARSALDQLPRMQEPGYTAASLSVDVYARFVWFEGIRYLASITNEALEDHECIWSPKPTVQVKAVLVAEDHLGIREVRVAGSPAVRAEREQPNLWWRAFTVNRGSTLHGRTDGIKLRGLREFNSPAFRDRMIPSPSMRSPGSTFRLGASTDPGEPLWTRRHTLNKPTTTGYIIGLYDDNGKLQVCDFQAWSPGEDMSLYLADRTFVDPEEEMFWFYFPVDRNERITEMWSRRAGGSTVQSRGWLLWATSQGRCFPFALRSRTEDSYSRLAELDNTKEQDVFLGVSGGSICEVMLQEPKPSPSAGTTGRPLRLPVHRSPHPRYSGRDECVFTSAPLKGISEMTVCRGGSAEDDGSPLVTGLFLRYNDGRVATVGSVRLDRLDRPLAVASSQGWRLLMQRDKRVTGVQLAPFPPTDSKLNSTTCLEGRWEGSLEWWTGLNNNCWVYHVGREGS